MQDSALLVVCLSIIIAMFGVACENDAVDYLLPIRIKGHTTYGTAFYFGEILGKRWCKTVPDYAHKIDKTGILGYHQICIYQIRIKKK